MNAVLRHLAFVSDFAVFGPSYAIIKYLIRSPQPLDAERTWNYITGKFAPLQNWMRLNLPPLFARQLLLKFFLRPPHEKGIAQHYDVSNDFYELFLDNKYMLYSCADFVTGRETLEEAQANKVRFIMNLLDPRPGERILELGCGWGGMLQEVYDRTGQRENIYGYTVSRQQVEYNAQHRGFNVEFKNFITDEYPREFFDKIFSIGAWEHVRPADLQATFEKLYGTLKPGGKLVMHFFCRPERTVGVAGLVGQIFFPGSLIPPYPVQLRTAQAVGFRVMHQSLHDTYKETLRAWFDRLVANRQRAIKLVGVETYNKYLLFFACSWRLFDDVQAILLRIVLQKPPIPARHELESGQAEPARLAT
jgi:cyclopropane-fatty-acyl-phospholipid synthase